MKMNKILWIFLFFVLVITAQAEETQDTNAQINNEQNFSNLKNGTGSEVGIKSLIVISGEFLQPIPEASVDYQFNVNQDKGGDGTLAWSYSNPSQSLIFSGLEGNLKEIKLAQTDHNISTSDGGENGKASAEVDQGISDEIDTRDLNFSTNISGDVVTVSWHDITYGDNYGQSINAGAQATVGSDVSSSNPSFTPTTATDINLNSTSVAHSPNGVLKASGNWGINNTIKGSLSTATYKTETSASIFGAGTIHSGSASVKFTKSSP